MVRQSPCAVVYCNGCVGCDVCACARNGGARGRDLAILRAIKSLEDLRHVLHRDLSSLVAEFLKDHLHFFSGHAVLGPDIGQDTLHTCQADVWRLVLRHGGTDNILLETSGEFLGVAVIRKGDNRVRSMLTDLVMA